METSHFTAYFRFSLISYENPFTLWPSYFFRQLLANVSKYRGLWKLVRGVFRRKIASN